MEKKVLVYFPSSTINKSLKQTLSALYGEKISVSSNLNQLILGEYSLIIEISPLTFEKGITKQDLEALSLIYTPKIIPVLNIPTAVADIATIISDHHKTQNKQNNTQ